jgi:DNA helicase-2/ATP-dependent DNA helicase PcrA
MSHLGDLNIKQKEAAEHREGPLLIIAGAGAGKTKTITHRIVNLIKHGVAPHEILAVTFTNKAAAEMRERILAEIRKASPLLEFSEDGVPFISTFHSLGVKIIKENARILNLTRHFSILDADQSLSLIKEIMKEMDLDPKRYSPKAVRSIISREKGNFIDHKNYQEMVSETDFWGQIVVKVWDTYESRKIKENSVDFDDLILKAVKLLKENLDIRKIYQDKWKYLHIDEYQDTNEIQCLMSFLLAENSKNICVVGDADQCIYSWRGANLKNILSFEKSYPEAKVVLLEENYRSTQNILQAANEIITKNQYRLDKNLFTQNPTGEKISYYEALSENEEVDFVAEKILGILESKNNQSLTLEPNSEIAILYRANFQSRVLEEGMLRHNIPYQVLGTKFFERKEIKDIIAYIRAALNPESLSDIKRIINFPARGIGKATLVKVFASEKDSLPAKTLIKIENFYKLLQDIRTQTEILKVSDLIKYVIKRSGLHESLAAGDMEDAERLENIKELVSLAKKYESLETQVGLEKFLEEAALVSDQDSLMHEQEGRSLASPRTAPGSQKVRLMTVHAAKGLEFKYVFVVGLEDGLFPHNSDGEEKSAEDSEEERRLFYVALTRAKAKVFLSWANYRTIFGNRQINCPSQFISDIPNNLLYYE